MSMACVTGGKLCDGCMACHAEPDVIGICAACGEEIHAGEDLYSIECDLIHEDCLRDWAAKFLIRGDD